MIELRRAMHWRLASVELPEPGLDDEPEIVLVACPTALEPVWLGYYEAGDWYDVDGARLYEVVAWMELPEMPKVDP